MASIALNIALSISLAPPVLALEVDSTLRAIEQRVKVLRASSAITIEGAPVAARSLVATFYERRGFEPVWSADKARELRALVAASVMHGLNPADYHAASLDALLARAADEGETAADRDIVATDALVRLVYHLRFGKANPRETHPEWNFANAAVDPIAALDALVSAPDLSTAVWGHAPRIPAYERLQQALARYRSIEAAGGWQTVPAGPVLKPGMADKRVPALRARLALSGDLVPGARGKQTLFDPSLVDAVRRFQSRHGLEPDGVVGAKTLSALEVGVGRRIDQLRVNLDRLRWVARDLADDYLLVDIAGFAARLYVHGQLAWASRVVVGRPYRSTPSFRATLQSLVLNPAWNVPPTILREDVLPSIFKDRAYLAKQGMRIVNAVGTAIDPAGIDWNRYRQGARFPYEIVQAPGPGNPLGALKFDMPNEHAVYLHDTPARQLFARPDRAFSSGCIRLEKARELAVILLDDPERWSAEALRAAIASGETRTLALKRRVPVLLLYFTAAVDERGVIHFHSDVYGRDDRVLTALDAPFEFHARTNGPQPAR